MRATLAACHPPASGDSGPRHLGGGPVVDGAPPCHCPQACGSRDIHTLGPAIHRVVLLRPTELACQGPLFTRKEVATMVSIEDARRRANASGARIPPHNLEAEESLLGAMMLS